MRRGLPHRRAAGLVAFALSGAIAAIAAIAPSTDAELLLSKTAVLEPVAIHAAESLLPAPLAYIREERFHHGDTLPWLLARLAIGGADVQRLLRLREMRLLRPGTHCCFRIE